MTYLQSLRRNSRDALPRLPENQWGNSPSLLQRNPPPSQTFFSQEGGKAWGGLWNGGDPVNRSFSTGRVGGDFLFPFRRNITEMLAEFCVILSRSLLPQKDWPDRNIGGGVPPFPPPIEWRGFSVTSPKNGAGRLLFHAFLSLPLFPS